MILDTDALNETSTIGTLRALFSSEMQFKILRKKGREYGTFEDLKNSELLTSLPNNHQKSGYQYTLYLTKDGLDFHATALPLTPSDGKRSFAVFSNGRMTFREDGKEPGKDDPEMD